MGSIGTAKITAQQQQQTREREPKDELAKYQVFGDTIKVKYADDIKVGDKITMKTVDKDNNKINLKWTLWLGNNNNDKVTEVLYGSDVTVTDVKITSKQIKVTGEYNPLVSTNKNKTLKVTKIFKHGQLIGQRIKD